MRRLPVALIGATLGSLLTASFICRPQSPAASSVPQGGDALQIQIPASAGPTPGDDEARRWAALRRTACDGPPLGPRRFNIPQSASIGRFASAAVQLLRTLNRREDLAKLANDLNLTGRAAELGVWRGEFSEQTLRVWRGMQYVLVDLWTPSDCVAGNRSHCVYGGNVSDGGVAERSFDRMITELRMKRLGPQKGGRAFFVQNSTLEAAKLFPDGHFDWIYLDAQHTYSSARADLEAWYPKVRLGGLVSGHDYQFQHQQIGDGYVFGVRDAVDEFAARRSTRVYSTMEQYLPSFYFLKCTLL